MFFLSTFLQTPLSIILFISFLMAVCQLFLSTSTGLCQASWKVLGSFGPDVTAEIRQVSWIHSSKVKSALSMDSFVGDESDFVSLLVLPRVSSLAPIMLISIPNFFCVSVLFPSSSDASIISLIDSSPKDLSSSNELSSSSRKSSTQLLA